VLQITLSIDGTETVRDFNYDISLINPGTVVFLGGSDNTTTYVRQSFRGVIHKVRIGIEPLS